MTTDETPPAQACPACGSVVDFAGLEPLSTVACPTCGFEMLANALFGEYELQEVMGRGGMGVVYRAYDHQLARQVALKVLRRDRASIEVITQLELEAAITASINHPHVVKVYTTGMEQGRFYIAMELVSKGTLDDLINLQGRVAEPQALEIASQIAQGLRAAHQHGLIHRDVKPGNILFADAHSAKIVDFGLAIMEEASVGSDEIWGTPYYVSPERLDQKPEDWRSDLYSLGATMFHALAGRPPFEAEDATRVALKHLKNEAVSLQAFAPWVSSSTAYVINRTLHKDPAQRYESYDEFIEHLEYARTEITQAKVARPVQKRVVVETEQDRARQGLLTGIILGAVALLGIGGGVAWYIWGPEPKPPAVTLPAGPIGGVGALAEMAAPYETARNQLLTGSPAQAAEGFKAIANDARAKEPLPQWALVHQGLAHLVAGNAAAATGAFSVLNNKPLKAGDDLASQRLAQFFKQMGQIGVSQGAVPASALGGLDVESYGALGILVGALKAWEAESMEEAAGLLRQFEAVNPKGTYSWVGDYRALSSQYLADWEDFQAVTKRVAVPNPLLADYSTMVSALRQAKGELRRADSLVLARRLEKLAAEAAAKAGELQRAERAKLEEERKTWSPVREKTSSLSREWKFDDALAAASVPRFATPEMQREQRVALARVRWLQEFKKTLIADLAAGHPGPLKTRRGETLAGPISAPTPEGVTAGGAPRTWAELSPESVLGMALSFVKPPLPNNVQAQRKWYAGIYALLTGQKGETRRLLLDSRWVRTEWQDQLPGLIPPRRQNVAKGMPVQASAVAAVTQDATKAVDGDTATAWVSTAEGDQTLQVDLGREVSIARWALRLAPPRGLPKETYAVDFAISSTKDGTTWTDVQKVRGNSRDHTDQQVPTFQAKQVKLTISKHNRLPAPDLTTRVFEFEVYGTDGSNDPIQDVFSPLVSAPAPELASMDLGYGQNEGTGGTALDERSGIFTVRGGGFGIGTGNTDGFRYAQRTFRGDGDLVVYLASVQRNVDNTLGGIMLREGTGHDSRMTFLGVSPARGLVWSVRKEPNQSANTSVVDGSLRAPCWLKLTRKGSQVTAFVSKDGLNWRQVGQDNVNLGNGTGGLAVTAGQTDGSANARMEVVQFGGMP